MALRGFLSIDPFNPNTPASVLDLMVGAYSTIIASEEEERAKKEREAVLHRHHSRLIRPGWGIAE